MIGKSVPTITINDVPILIIANSCEYEKGFSEINVRAASVGGGGVDAIHTENVENKVGMVKFQVPVVDAIIQQFPIWKEAVAANTVKGIDKRGIPFNLILASFTNKPKIPPTADGVIDIEFKAGPMAI